MRNYLYSLLGLFCLNACSEDPTDPIVNTTSDLIALEYVLDFGNEGDANDLIVRYQVKNTSDLSEVWLFIAPDADFLKLNSTTLGQLSSDRFQNISISGSLTDVRPSSSLLDTEGNPIQHNKAYKLGFATVKGNEISKGIIAYSFELKDQHYLTGRYVGIWNDDKYSEEYSTEISMVANVLKGPIYWSNNFASHYGSGDEGTITFKDNGDQLMEVRYDEFLSGFMDGCEGLWTGTGSVENLVKLRFELKGMNCDHSSSNVILEFTRFE